MPIYVEKPQEYDVRQVPSDPDEQIGFLIWLQNRVVEAAFLMRAKIDGSREDYLSATLRLENIGVNDVRVLPGCYMLYNFGSRAWTILGEEEFEQNFTKVRG